MRIRIAWCNLRHAKARTATAVVGVALPTVLVLVQLALYAALRDVATFLSDGLDLDAVIVSQDYLSAAQPGRFPRVRLSQAAAVPGVRQVAPLYLGFSAWRNPDTGVPRNLLVIGTDVRQPAFRNPDLAGQIVALRRLDTMLFDRQSRPEFGHPVPGTRVQLGGRSLEIVGRYTLGSGFVADAGVVVSEGTFARLFPRRSPDEVSLGLLQLQPGHDVAAVVAEVTRLLPRDVHVLSRGRFEASERGYWLENTPIGLIFGSGVAIGLVVQLIVLGQLLVTDVSKRLREYATLKALGSTSGRLATIVIEQAVLLSLAGFVVGLALALPLHRLLAEETLLPIEMDVGRSVLVLGLTLLTCAGAGLLALRRLQAADPADLF
jgi:putative ABC transport system permease protein